MMKLLLGGSPCTHWSIAQSRWREVKPEGQGWELFRNYHIAKERYCPDFFLYENNGWTVDVIVHILSYCPGITTEPVEVLSMYDGMSCGRLALNKLGAHITRYYATEIDKYAIKTTQTNFPDALQLGNAFGVREGGWWSFILGKSHEPGVL